MSYTAKPDRVLARRRYGKLRVLKIVYRSNRWRENIYKCVCDCGNIVQRKGLRLHTSHEASACDECSECRGYMPTPEDIREACERIRSGWSRREAIARGEQPKTWDVPGAKFQRRFKRALDQ